MEKLHNLTKQLKVKYNMEEYICWVQKRKLTWMLEWSVVHGESTGFFHEERWSWKELKGR